jgi:hypothetical protein
VADAQPERRLSWSDAAEPGAPGWRVLEDEALLGRIESTPVGSAADPFFLEVVGSQRHFFIRQQAAKKVSEPELLKRHSDDRHIGQILVRVMTRREDVAYLERLVSHTRHLEVRNAAIAQLKLLARALKGEDS